jgi:hypothetical protein
VGLALMAEPLQLVMDLYSAAEVALEELIVDQIDDLNDRFCAERMVDDDTVSKGSIFEDDRQEVTVLCCKMALDTAVGACPKKKKKQHDFKVKT